MLVVDQNVLDHKKLKGSNKSIFNIKIWCKLIYKTLQYLSTFPSNFLFYTFLYEFIQIAAITFHTIVIFIYAKKTETTSTQEFHRI